MKHLRQAIFWLVLFCCLASIAGTDPGITIIHNRGILWAHRKSMLHLEAPTYGYDVNLYLFTERSDMNWSRAYNSPRIGITLSYLDLGKPEVTGKVFGLLPFIEFRLLHQKKQELNFRMGAGLGYLTKKWDLATNRLNNAIGTHVNGNMRLHFLYHRQIGPHWELTAVAGITHYSNGNFRLPNLGVNSVEAGIGIGYNLNGIPNREGIYTPDSTARRQRSEIRFSFGTKETSLIYPKRVFAFDLGLRHYLFNWEKLRLCGGLDFFYDPGYVYRDNPNDVQGGPNMRNSMEMALCGGGELWLGKFSFIGEGGIYLYTPDMSYYKGPIYQRVGFRYKINPEWSCLTTLKAHFARADYFEWGIAYTIVH